MWHFKKYSFIPFGWSCIDSLKPTISAFYTHGALSDQNQYREGCDLQPPRCPARCNNPTGKWCSLSDRQSREITKTILSGGLFVTAYPQACPAPSFLFSLFVYKSTWESMCSLTLNIKCGCRTVFLAFILSRIYLKIYIKCFLRKLIQRVKWIIRCRDWHI